MPKMYALNKKTHCYHIRDYCQYAKSTNVTIEWIDSEEAVKRIDPSARLCSTCERKREQQIKK